MAELTDQEKRIKRLRRYINDTAEDDFDTEELTEVLEDSADVYSAASKLWRIKAGMIQGELGLIEQYSAGNESYKHVNLTTAMNAATKMADEYASMSSEDTSTKDAPMVSYMLGVKKPDVM